MLASSRAEQPSGGKYNVTVRIREIRSSEHFIPPRWSEITLAPPHTQTRWCRQ
ncbi:hypothetical protein KCP75_09385 [Salmonella enterica subsp. enterica]|nr:hypothetical protein KCP75_09385 [Salmonella enterica subsp. enterica]